MLKKRSDPRRDKFRNEHIRIRGTRMKEKNMVTRNSRCGYTREKKKREAKPRVDR